MSEWKGGDVFSAQVSEETDKWMKAYSQLVGAHRIALAKLSDAKIATRKWHAKALNLQKRYNRVLVQLQQTRNLQDCTVMQTVSNETMHHSPTSIATSTASSDESEGWVRFLESPVRGADSTDSTKVDELTGNIKNGSGLKLNVSEDLQSRSDSRDFYCKDLSQPDQPNNALNPRQYDEPEEQPQSLHLSHGKGLDDKKLVFSKTSLIRLQGVGVEARSDCSLTNSSNVISTDTDKSETISTNFSCSDAVDEIERTRDGSSKHIKNDVCHNWMSSVNLISNSPPSWAIPETKSAKVKVGVNRSWKTLRGVAEDGGETFERHDERHGASADGECIRLLLKQASTDNIMEGHRTKVPEALQAIYRSRKTLNKSATYSAVDNWGISYEVRSVTLAGKATSLTHEGFDHPDQGAILPRDQNQAFTSEVDVSNNTQRSSRGSLLCRIETPGPFARSNQWHRTGSRGSSNSHRKRKLSTPVGTLSTESRSTRPKHKHRLKERHPTPPGLWETEMADTQELQRLRDGVS